MLLCCESDSIIVCMPSSLSLSFHRYYVTTVSLFINMIFIIVLTLFIVNILIFLFDCYHFINADIVSVRLFSAYSPSLPRLPAAPVPPPPWANAASRWRCGVKCNRNRSKNFYDHYSLLSLASDSSTFLNIGPLVSTGDFGHESNSRPRFWSLKKI